MRFNNLLLQDQCVNLNQSWHKGSLRDGDSGLFKWRSMPYFPRGDNYEIAKILWQYLKVSSSRTSVLISTKLGTMHPWVKGIQVCLNKGPNPFPRGDYYKISENTLTKLKNLFSRTTEPISTNFGTKHPWVRIQIKKPNKLS